MALLRLTRLAERATDPTARKTQYGTNENKRERVREMRLRHGEDAELKVAPPAGG
jgi:hypothetical protein